MARELTQEIIIEFVLYNPLSGVFTWKERDKAYFRSEGACAWWNSEFAGREAGWINDAGYRLISVFDHAYRAHRLAFLYMEGAFPPHEVDHDKGNRDDNRWHKIQAATRVENGKNRCLPTNNTSGHMGVTLHKSTGKWYARIWVDGENKYLGFFEEKEDAVKARKEAEKKYGYHPNHGRIENACIRQAKS